MRRSTTLLLAVVATTSSLALAACGDTDDTSSADMPMSDSGMDGTMDGSMGHDGGHDESSPVADGARRVEVTATSFEFDPDETHLVARNLGRG